MPRGWFLARSIAAIPDGMDGGDDAYGVWNGQGDPAQNEAGGGADGGVARGERDGCGCGDVDCEYARGHGSS